MMTNVQGEHVSCALQAHFLMINRLPLIGTYLATRDPRRDTWLIPRVVLRGVWHGRAGTPSALP